MQKIAIEGGVPLSGTIAISGAKNAALPLLTASLLSDKPLTLNNVPDLADIRTLVKLLEQHGTTVERNENRYTLQTKTITSPIAPYELVRQMRASILVLGALVARCGEAKVSLPGGCAIGSRPVDLHLKGLETLGAKIKLEEGYIIAKAPKGGLKGAVINMPFISVGATENLIMAACLAKGETVIQNAAREPEVVDLCLCLNSMGARIERIGTASLHIQGVSQLEAANYSVLPDRIETGTYMAAAAITKGQLKLTNTRQDLLQCFTEKLQEAGIEVGGTKHTITIDASNGHMQGVDIMTEPHPAFPTDLQAQFMAMMCLANGASMITETIFENRFMHVPELCRMGADITIHNRSALVRGKKKLKGAPVMATDLRASSSLILAGLAAHGSTTIDRVYHLDRGYEKLEEKLTACGARIQRLYE